MATFDDMLKQPETIEKVAAALAKSNGIADLSTVSEITRDAYRRDAKAAIAAILHL